MSVDEWTKRFTAPWTELPLVAAHAPHRAVVVAKDRGTTQAYSVDLTARRLAPATARDRGIRLAAIDHDGDWLWWFDDNQGGERGRWRAQPFGSEPGASVDPLGLPDANPTRVLFGPGGQCIVGRSDASFGTQIHSAAIDPSSGQAVQAPAMLYAHGEFALPAALNRRGDRLAVEHTESGDLAGRAVRVVDAAHGAVVADLCDGPDRPLWVEGFANHTDRLLVRHMRRGAGELMVWDIASGDEQGLSLGLPGDVVKACWYPDDTAVLALMAHHARTRLHRFDLGNGTLERIGPARGTVENALVRPDGDVWYRWSSAAQAPAVRSVRTGDAVLAMDAHQPPRSVDVEDLWVEGPDGRIHALLRRPRGREAPYPTIFSIHGGPTEHDTDSFRPGAARWVDEGYAVVQVNYRGSTGYGAAWMKGIRPDPGFVELADIAAVHDHLVEHRVVDARRSVLAGISWGGYLTLLGLGTQPERWAAGLAELPVADFHSAYHDAMAFIQAFDRALFGGSPSDVPERYRRASPLTYVDRVSSPVLILASRNDPRCPRRQIEAYLSALARREATHQVYWFESGHGVDDDDEAIRQERLKSAFVARHVG